eukprot:g16133.t1
MEATAVQMVGRRSACRHGAHDAQNPTAPRSFVPRYAREEFHTEIGNYETVLRAAQHETATSLVASADRRRLLLSSILPRDREHGRKIIQAGLQHVTGRQLARVREVQGAKLIISDYRASTYQHLWDVRAVLRDRLGESAFAMTREVMRRTGIGKEVAACLKGLRTTATSGHELASCKNEVVGVAHADTADNLFIGGGAVVGGENEKEEKKPPDGDGECVASAVFAVNVGAAKLLAGAPLATEHERTERSPREDSEKIRQAAAGWVLDGNRRKSRKSEHDKRSFSSVSVAPIANATGKTADHRQHSTQELAHDILRVGQGLLERWRAECLVSTTASIAPSSLVQGTKEQRVEEVLAAQFEEAAFRSLLAASAVSVESEENTEEAAKRNKIQASAGTKKYFGRIEAFVAAVKERYEHDPAGVVRKLFHRQGQTSASVLTSVVEAFLGDDDDPGQFLPSLHAHGSCAWFREKLGDGSLFPTKAHLGPRKDDDEQPPPSGKSKGSGKGHVILAAKGGGQQSTAVFGGTGRGDHDVEKQSRPLKGQKGYRYVVAPTSNGGAAGLLDDEDADGKGPQGFVYRADDPLFGEAAPPHKKVRIC